MLDITEVMMRIRESSSTGRYLGRLLSLAIATFVVLGITSCGCRERGESTENGQDAGASADADIDSSGPDAPEPLVDTDSRASQFEPLCSLNNLTQPCVCAIADGQVTPGRQACNPSTGWGPCECYSEFEVPPAVITPSDAGFTADPVKNKGPERFDWQRTVALFSSCKEGHYQGKFEGQYIPSITFGFDVSDVSGEVSFDLIPSATGEFLEITGGRIQGVADGDIPFEGDMVGTLDCATGYMNAYLQNCSYIYLMLFFEGPLLANYDKFNDAFVQGVWSVTEPDANGVYPTPLPVSPGDPLPSLSILSVFGGVGRWAAIHVP